MSDQATCRCAHSPALASVAATGSVRCPLCGQVRRPARSLPADKLAVQSSNFKWSPQANVDAATSSEPISIQVETSAGSVSPKIAARNRGTGSPLAGRAIHSLQLQQKVCRFLGTAIGIWSLFSLTPGWLAWRYWLTDFSATNLPFWLPANLVLAGLPLLVGLLLIQIPDWGTLKAVAGSLLAIASAYGFTASLFALAEPDSAWLSALDFPFSETKRATVWCLAMAILAGLLSFACFREGQRWQRIGELLTHLLPAGEPEPSSSGSADR